MSEKNYSFEHPKYMHECPVCGEKFDIRGKVYIAVNSNFLGLIGAEQYFDAVDCPSCQCQKILGDRMQRAKMGEDDFCSYRGR